MPLVITERATDAPISLSEAKVQCRVVDSDTTHDARLRGYIWDATASIERLTGAALSRKTVRLDLDGFPSGEIDLGIYPVNSVTSVVYDDTDNVQQTLTSSPEQYWSSLGGMYPKISPITVWPSTKSGKPASVRITMNVGYQGDVPHDLRHAILMRVGEYFNNSAESVLSTEVFATVSSVADLISQWRRIA